jgi:hypothetical protein
MRRVARTELKGGGGAASAELLLDPGIPGSALGATSVCEALAVLFARREHGQDAALNAPGHVLAE